MKGQRVVALSCLLLVVGATKSTVESDEQNAADGLTVSCGVYLAPSTILGAGFGMFAGKDYVSGDQVTDGDIVIPLIEVDEKSEFDSSQYFLWDDYHWAESEFLGMEGEEADSDQVFAACPGIGAALNSLPLLDNIETSPTKLDNAGLHRSRDPGAGAFTPYHDHRGYATEDIHAGQELFVSYGEDYFRTRSKTYWRYGFLSTEGSFKLMDVFNEWYATSSSSSDLWNVVISIPWYVSRATGALLRSILQLIGIDKMMKTTMMSHDDHIRDVSWLEKHGSCMDNIRPGLSTIPQAGRGAFTSRFIPKGTVVAPAPLIHIPDKSRLNIYENGNKRAKLLHRQLLVNYCFGHANSSLLLSPYGSFTSLINHRSKSPNAKIEWALDMMDHSDWFNASVEYIGKQSQAGLMFNFVAIRDILEGEEVLIDYGKEWEDAWNKHVPNWTPGSETYIPAYELNDDADLVIRTIKEEAYPDNLLLYVRDEYRTMYGLEEGKFQQYQCRVFDRYQVEGNTVYMAELFIATEDDETTYLEYLKEVLFGVPRDAFVFNDVPYSRDHSMHSSFRHEIMIPDGMFPDSWKNQ